MAILPRAPFLLSLPPPAHKLYHQNLHKSLSNFNLTSNKQFAAFASSVSKIRVTRKVKSSEELCGEIREFVAVVGFPEGYVPSVKEFSEHGRKDLANIVRRRGYKRVKELLESSIKAENNEIESKQAGQGESKVEDVSLLTQAFGTEAILQTKEVSSYSNSLVNGVTVSRLTSQNEKINSTVEDEYSSHELSTAGSYNLKLDTSYKEGNDGLTLESKTEQVNNTAEDVSVLDTESYTSSLNSTLALNSDDLVVETLSSNIEKNPSCSGQSQTQQVNNVAEDYINSPNNNESDNRDDKLKESSTSFKIDEKVARFIQTGDMDSVEDSVYSIINESGVEESEESTTIQDVVDIQSRSTDQEQSKNDCNGKINGRVLPNGSISRADSAASLKHSHRDDHLRPGNAYFNKDSHVETIKRENLVEIKRLKSLLHQKELELSKLKEQIEKEKLALSNIQKRAETEINKAEQLISEKDAELHAAEESLSGLQEVEIQYSGDGETVELTGSFNGWHHQVEMERQPSSITKPSESSKPAWSTTLWLYPGTYEIKFIVNGQWRIDPQRETVTKDHITNNILIVNG